MNSMISYSKLAAVALCGAVLMACNAVQDVSSAPTYPLPAQTVVVTGTVTGVPLSTTRPVVLEDDGQQRCAPPGSPTTYTGPLVYCTYSVAGTAVIRFGSLPVGAPYNIKVTKQPFGRACTLSNATGVANAAVSNIVLNCVRDATPDATPLHTVTANIAPAVANALPAGFKVTLTTEEGTETIVPTAGQTQVVFTKPVFDAGSSPPVFAYLVTATAELTPGVVSNCAVTGATNLAADGTGAVSPKADVSTTVTQCLFTISGAVTYNQPPQTVYTPQTITGLQLGLRYQATGEIVDTVAVSSFTPATAAASSAFTFPTARLNNSQGLYDVTVTTQPTSGQFCTVDGGGIAPLVVLPAWATSTANFPATQPANITGIAVRCRNIPDVANRLVGTYQVVGQNSTFTTVGTPSTAINTAMGTLNPGSTGFGTTQTTAISTANQSGTVSTNTVSDDRRFLTFFANGTFLYGVHTGSANTTNGLEHGFYSYDSVAKTIYYTITTDNNGVTANSIASGLSGTPGQCTVVPGPVNFPQGTVVSASDAAFSNPAFKTTYLGIPAANTAAAFSTPFWIFTGVSPPNTPPPATYAFNGKATGTWSAPQNLGG